MGVQGTSEGYRLVERMRDGAKKRRVGVQVQVQARPDSRCTALHSLWVLISGVKTYRLAGCLCKQVWPVCSHICRNLLHLLQ